MRLIVRASRGVSPARAAACLALAAAALAGGPARGQEPGDGPGDGAIRREIPVYDLTTPGYTLAAEVAEAASAWDQPIPWDEIPALLAAAGADDPDLVAMGCVYHVVRDELDRAAAFYPDAQAGDPGVRQRSAFLHKLLTARGEPAALRVVKSWLFGAHREAILELTPRQGEPILFSVGLARAGDRWVRLDDWGGLQPAQLLFWFMTTNLKKGLVAGRPPEALPHEILLAAPGAPEHPLILRFEGRIYPATGEWTPVEPSEAAADEARAFAHRVLSAATGGSDQEFLALFAGEERVEMEALYAQGSGRFEGLRESLEVSSPIRDLATVTLGSFRVHYFLERSDPSEVRTIVFREADGGYSLSQELHGNLEILFRSPLVARSLLARAAGRNHEPPAGALPGADSPVLRERTHEPSRPRQDDDS